MRRTSLSAVGAAIVLVSLPAAASGATAQQDAAAQRLERRALALVNAAALATRRDPRCLRRSPATTITHDAPSQEMLDTFVLLRRPQIPQDLDFVARGGLDSLAGAEGVHVDWIRMARAADGSEHYLVIAQGRSQQAPTSRVCVQLQQRLLLRSLKGKPARLRRLALRTNARLQRAEQQRAGRLPSRELILAFARDGSSGGGTSDLASFREHGLFGSTQSSDGDSSTVTGFVPDGVATIEVTFAQRVHYGPQRPANDYGSEIHLTVPVQDNVTSFQVARPSPDAFPTTMVWRAADGSVVRVVRGQ